MKPKTVRLGHDVLKPDERPAADEQDVAGIDVLVVLQFDRRTLHNFEQGMLHAFAGGHSSLRFARFQLVDSSIKTIPSWAFSTFPSALSSRLQGWLPDLLIDTLARFSEAASCQTERNPSILDSGSAGSGFPVPDEPISNFTLFLRNHPSFKKGDTFRGKNRSVTASAPSWLHPDR